MPLEFQPGPGSGNAVASPLSTMGLKILATAFFEARRSYRPPERHSGGKWSENRKGKPLHGLQS